MSLALTVKKDETGIKLIIPSGEEITIFPKKKSGSGSNQVIFIINAPTDVKIGRVNNPTYKRPISLHEEVEND
jgi:hypothetical protein